MSDLASLISEIVADPTSVLHGKCLLARELAATGSQGSEAIWEFMKEPQLWLIASSLSRAASIRRAKGLPIADIQARLLELASHPNEFVRSMAPMGHEALAANVQRWRAQHRLPADSRPCFAAAGCR